MPKLQPKGKGHKVYTFNQDYALGGKKKGDEISLAKVPVSLMPYFDETAPKAPAPKTVGERPTDKTKKDDIIDWLIDNGIPESETSGLSKEDLLDLVQQVK